MNSEQFENLARLYVVGALEPQELVDFEKLRRDLGDDAEECIQECERLNAAFALTLRPTPPDISTREKLLARIRSVAR